MKKFLAYLLLVACGLAIVHWFDRRSGEADEADAQDRAVLANDAALLMLTIPEDATPGLNLRGKFVANFYDESTGNVVLNVSSEDSLSGQAADELTDVEVIVMDPNHEQSLRLGMIQSRSANLPRGGSSGVHPTYLNQVFLSDVEGHFERGVPIAPLDFTTPTATIDATRATHLVLEGDAPIRLSSPELQAGADSYRIDALRPSREELDESLDTIAGTRGREEIIHLQTNGWAEFRRVAAERTEPGTDPALGGLRSARIEAIGGGPMQIRRTGDVEAGQPRTLFFEVKGRGRLSLRGDEVSDIEGDRVVLRGTVLKDVDVIRPERLDLHGNVVWTVGQSVFTADDCGIDFIEGEFVHALLSGGVPTLRLALDIDESRANDVPTGMTLEEFKTVRIASTDTIELSRRNGLLHYRVVGPATLETGGMHLRSNGDLTGETSTDGSTMTFAGSGGVVIEAGNGTVEAADFELSLSVDENDVQTLRGTASGGARLVGTIEDGRGFTVTTPDRLVFERVGSRLRIIEGFGVEVSVDGSDGFYARCDHLVDLRVEEMTFVAEGHVLFRTGEDEAICDRMESRGRKQHTLWGNEESRAVFKSPLGHAEALFVERNGDELRARGNVTALLTALPTDTSGMEEITFDAYELACERLEFIRSSNTRDDRSVVHKIHISATNEVRMTLRTNGRTLRLNHADFVKADRVAHLAHGRANAARISANTDVTATGAVEAHLVLGEAGQSSEVDVYCDTLDMTLAAQGDADPERSVLAVGNVRFAGTGKIDLQGEGDTLRLDTDETAYLEASESERVRLWGLLPTNELPFELTATEAVFTAQRIEAVEPEISVDRADAVAADDESEGVYRARARRLVASEQSLELIHDVRFSGTNSSGIQWTLDSRRIQLEARGDESGGPSELSRISATGGVVFQLGPGLVARAESLFGVGPSGVLRLTGTPTTIETPTNRLTAEWIDFDPELQIILETGKGRIEGLAAPEGGGAQSGAGQSSAIPSIGKEGWTLEYQWSTTRIDQDSLVFFLQEPVFHNPEANSTLRASWSVLWLDRRRYGQIADGTDLQVVEPEPAADNAPLGPMRVFFDFIDRNGAASVVQEAYFEGPVQIVQDDLTFAHADAVYFDLTSGHGWLAGATINMYDKFAGEDEEEQQEYNTLSIKTKWLRHTADGTLRAKGATVTTCSFDKPHVTIVTGDLRLTPLSDDIDGGYHVSMRDNRIEMYDAARIPLPPIAFDTDEELKPRLPSLSFGNSARLGQLFGLKFSGSARRVGGFIHDLFTFDDEYEAEAAPGDGSEPQPKKKRKKRRKPYDASYDIDAKYLGSRGALFDLGFTFKATDRVWFEFLTGIAFDSGEDKGFVSVPESERDHRRLWLRSHGEIELEDAKDRRPGYDHRILFSYSDQSDPGVQSEFFESDFVRYEEDETYVQWKRSFGHIWTQATIAARVDEFRAGVEELPSVTAFRGRAPIAHIGSVPIVHTGDLNAEYLRRTTASTFGDLDGDGLDDTLTGPFAPTGRYPDEPGAQSVFRLDSTHLFEAPISTGVGGLKFTPFVSLRGTTWDDARDEDTASRLLAHGGARLSTTFWRRGSNGKLDQVAPYIQYRANLGEDIDGTPYVFDKTETPLYADLIDVGTRARFGIDDEGARYDLDLRGIYASNRADGVADGWLPLEVFARANLTRGRRRFNVWYDGRFDLDDGRSDYSLFSLGTRFPSEGTRFRDRGGIQLSHLSGRDDASDDRFNAASIAGFYRWTEKWEFEARQSFSFLEDSRLGTSILVRRYGHDVVFEVESEVREGEGSSINFRIRPRLRFKPSRIGFVGW